MLSSSYLLAASLLSLWCALHSALISNRVTEWLQQKAGRRYRFYRLFFNLFALLTFLPVFYYYKTLPAEMLFRWDGGLRAIQLLLIAISFYLLLAGARRYDALQFLGIRQLKDDSNHKMLNKSGQLDIDGLHKFIRHPWYSGSILIIWSRNLDSAALVQNIILTAYLIIGTYLEEQKLFKEFGPAYRNYQQTVSMFLPLKWLRTLLQNKK